MVQVQRSAVPTVDFASFRDGTDDDRRRTACQVDAAMSSMGFLYLKNHGIEQSKIDDCFQWSKQFFSLSDQQKSDLRRDPEPLHPAGYSSTGEQNVLGHGCEKESFDCGNPADEKQANLWPDKLILVGFQEHVQDFYMECSRLTDELLECLSIALSLPKTTLSKHHSKSNSTLSLLHYPPVRNLDGSAGPNVPIRIPAHADFNTLTLLFQNDQDPGSAGLEVADPLSVPNFRTITSTAFEAQGGEFIPAPPQRGAVLVNVGYLLMRWTNGRWISGIHRVMPRLPPLSSHGNVHDLNNMDGNTSDIEEKDDIIIIPSRYSIPFFACPDPDAMVDALPGCWNNSTAPKKWKALNAGEYLVRKRRAIYTKP